MKATTIILVIFISVQSSIFGQWEEKNISTDQTLTGVHFISDNVGFVTGSNKIFKTEDGGENWVTSHSSNDVVFYEGVYALDENVVIAVGKDFDINSSKITRTTNGGKSWEDIQISNSSLLRSIVFVSPSLVYCSGGSGTILKSTNAGENWEELNTGTQENLLSIYFVNDSIGIAVGGKPTLGEIIKTEDGGNTWNAINSLSSNYLQSVFFTSQETGYAVGWEGEILKTADCGNSWTNQNSVSMSGNLDVTFINNDIGYITGGSLNEPLIQKTINGGELWEDVSPESIHALTSIQFPSMSIGYAVGSNGSVVKTESGGITSLINITNDINLVQIYPNPANNSITINSKSNEAINTIKIFDINGILIKKYNTYSESCKINMSEFSPNIYFIEIQTKSKRIVTRIVKR